MIFKTISTLFLIVAIVCILDLRPQQIADDVLKLTVKKQTIRDQARALRTGKKKKTIGQRLLYVQTSLAAMGRESKFAVVICASIVLFGVGAVIGVLINNVFLAPTFAAFLAALRCSRRETQIAQVASPVMFSVVRPMSKILSTPMISAMPSTGTPICARTIASMIGPAPETPAVPMEASTAVRTICAICPNVRFIP